MFFGEILGRGLEQADVRDDDLVVRPRKAALGVDIIQIEGGEQGFQLVHRVDIVGQVHIAGVLPVECVRGQLLFHLPDALASAAALWASAPPSSNSVWI